jgi:hypothetical protein
MTMKRKLGGVDFRGRILSFAEADGCTRCGCTFTDGCVLQSRVCLDRQKMSPATCESSASPRQIDPITVEPKSLGENMQRRLKAYLFISKSSKVNKKGIYLSLSYKWLRGGVVRAAMCDVIYCRFEFHWPHSANNHKTSDWKVHV